MCGIAGLFARSGAPDPDELEAMNDAQAHRGPNEGGTYVDGPVGLAHRRLSIIAPNDGRQPITNEDDSVAVTFNGEIYNHVALRDRLESRGHTFSTATDTEVLVHLYEERGPAFVESLEGMFAFALWDADRERLLLARDRMGIKPLAVLEDDGGVAFSSEVPALLATTAEHGGLDEAAVAAYFAYGFVPAPDAIFENVWKVRPGERVLVTAEETRRETYYTPSVRTHDPGLDRAATELRDRIYRAIEDRLMSDVPLGAFLSGGLDSSIVVGVMADLLEEPVRTFTVGFEEGAFDERWAADTVARHHGTDHTTYTVTPADVRDAVPEVLGRIGEPFADPSLIPTSIVARETSEEVTVAVSGDGADELFAGYDRYRGEYLSKYYRALPAPVRTHLVEPAVGRLPASRTSATGELARKLQTFVRGGTPDVSDRHFGWMRTADDEAAAAVGHDTVAAGRNRLRREHEDALEWLPEQRRAPLTRIQAVDTRFGLPNQMLRKVDRASMRQGLEVRVPMLDTGVFEYAFGLPRRYKMTETARKRILKRAFSDLLPSEIRERDKQGFDMPIGQWLAADLADEFREAVEALDTPLIDANAVMEVYASHRGDEEHGKFLWGVFVFATWFERLQNEGVLP